MALMSSKADVRPRDEHLFFPKEHAHGGTNALQRQEGISQLLRATGGNVLSDPGAEVRDDVVEK